jgi:hypothetical protein
MLFGKNVIIKRAINDAEPKEFAIRAFRSLVIAFFISFVIGDVLYIHVRLNPDYDVGEWITIEYFMGLYALLLGTALFLTPFPSIKNFKLAFFLKVIKNLCIVAAILLPYHYYIFTIYNIYGSYYICNDFMESRNAMTIIFAALLFAALFHFEMQKKY